MPFERPLLIVVLSLASLALFLTLGSVVFVLMAHLPLNEMMPWTALELGWQYRDNARARELLLQSHGISTLGVLMLAGLVWQQKQRPLHGDARWATARDLKKADPSLLATTGIFLGKFKNRYLIQGGQTFVLMAAGTRGGKGVSVVIPNCLNWTDSLVVTDIKLENFKITAGFRASCGQDVFLFSPAPADRRTHRWNPLDYVSRDEHQRISDLQRIAALLISETKDPVWCSDARELFVGITLMIMDNPELPFTLGEIYRQLHPGKDFKVYLADILDNEEEWVCRSSTARMILSKYAEMHEKSLKSVTSTLSPVLNLFANPILDAATSASDFDLRTLRQRKQTIYIGMTPDDLDTYPAILRLFYQQLISVNTRGLPHKETEPYQVVMLMDEFAALGKMAAFVNALSFMAGYNLRFLGIIQSLGQLRELYRDKPDTLVENVATWVFFAAKTHKTATDVANELGDTTTSSQSQSRDRGFSGKLGSKTDWVAKRGLLLPQEVKTIGADALLLLSDNCPPILAKKAVYYKIDVFLRRCVPKDRLKQARKTRTQEDFMACVRPRAGNSATHGGAARAEG